MGAFALLVLAGCSGGTPANDSASTTAAPATVASTPSAPATTTADVFTLSIGDCLNNTSDTRVSDVPTVDCSAPHDLEVYYDFDLDDSTSFPGSGPIEEAAQTACKEAFAGYVGLDYEQSMLAFTEFVPTETSWTSGDRTVTCVLGDPNGTSTGSLRGVGR